MIAASGPSQRKEDIEAARGRARVIAINETWRLAPWADALYACDRDWWRVRAPGVEFRGLWFIGSGEWPGCVPCSVLDGRDAIDWSGESLSAGKNSGFQALNLAAVCGARRVILTGFDMRGGHWHGWHGSGLRNPTDRMLAAAARIMDAAAPDLAARGVEVINASRETALTAFRRASIRAALE